MPIELDRTRPYGESHPPEGRMHFFQDGRWFDQNGQLSVGLPGDVVPDPVMPPPAAEAVDEPIPYRRLKQFVGRLSGPAGLGVTKAEMLQWLSDNGYPTTKAGMDRYLSDDGR